MPIPSPIAPGPVEQHLPLPCPFCETSPILRTKVARNCTFFRCTCCRKVWGVPGVSRTH